MADHSDDLRSESVTTYACLPLYICRFLAIYFVLVRTPPRNIRDANIREYKNIRDIR